MNMKPVNFFVEEKPQVNDNASLRYDVIDSNRVKCKACAKVLTINNYNRHLNVCKGVPKNTCLHCKKLFNSQQSHSRHQKICKINPMNYKK